MIDHFRRFAEIFRCPKCGAGLEAETDVIKCETGDHEFPVVDGIPRLFVANDWEQTKKDVTDQVKEFYEETPFPNYDDFDSVADLITKSRKGRFARLLDEQLPLGTKVLEVGCGTGQLSNFLGIAQRTVFGADMCLNSLRLAENFRHNNNLARVGFYQMNLFRPVFKEQTFDLVVSNGVLHHTSDPLGAYKSIAPLVKPGGYIVIGLYNKWGRLMNNLRTNIYKVVGRRFLGLDPYLRERGKDDAKTNAWFADQYQHPHESKHTMGEVLDWFDQTDYEFVNSIPKNQFLQGFDDEEQLFAPCQRSDKLTLGAVQMHMILTGNREGGLFIMIGRRK